MQQWGCAAAERRRCSAIERWKRLCGGISAYRLSLNSLPRASPDHHVAPYRAQETPDLVPEGETPYTLMLYAYQGLCDSVLPGDRVTVRAASGVWRCEWGAAVRA
jgi:DNA replicative helicase MCM subunit Mcm2 (Cdc46/Mcm family)